jgi:hypothetical protein
MKNIYTLLLLITFFNLSAQVPNYLPTDSLIAWWPFNGNANDESGNGNDGNVNGPLLTTDRFGTPNSAFSFDGIDDFIKAPKNTVYSNGITFNAWAFIVDLNGVQTIFANWGSSSSMRTFALYYQNFNFRTSIQLDNIQNYSISSIPTETNNWKMLTGTFDGSNLNLYENGQLITSTPTPNLSFNSSQYENYTIGTEDTFIQFFDGKIDDVGIWNRALDSTEIKQLYTGTVSQDICTYFDTISVYDTIAVYDTLTYYDTVQIAVTDTLIIDILLTGVAQPNNAKTIKVYPNPAKNVVIIDNGDYSALNNYRLKIINSLGQEVFDSSINIPQFQIPVSVLGTVGLYYIKVFDDNNSLLETKKLILK